MGGIRGLKGVEGFAVLRHRVIGMVPPVGLEPTHLAPEASALSAELRGRTVNNIAVPNYYNNRGMVISPHPSLPLSRGKGLTDKGEGAF